RRGRSSGVRASGRATCIARSAARGPRGRLLRDTAGEEPCRSSASLGALDGLHALLELDPLAPFAFDRGEAVDDSLEHAPQADAAVGTLELRPQTPAAERSEDRRDGVLGDVELDGQGAVIPASLEQRREGGAQIV